MNTVYYKNPSSLQRYLGKLFLIVCSLFFESNTQAQSLVVGNNQTVTITSNTYYSSITVNNGGTLNVLAPAVLTVGLTGTAANTQVVDFQNGSIVNIASGATMVINGRLNNSNNSTGTVINGTMNVNGNVSGGNGSNIIGGGSLTSTGSITGDGTFFGNSSDCSPGPCNGNNLCTFATPNQITASGNTTHCTTTNTTPIIDGSSISTAAYEWRSSATLTGTYNVLASNVIDQNFTPPINLTTTRYYVRNATVSGCTQTSNIISVQVGAVPVIVAQPANSQTVCIGSSVSFSVSATGNVLTYGWRKGTTDIPGATSATYTINPVILADAATNYNCLVTSTSCTIPNTTTTANSALVVTNSNIPSATASTNASFCVGGTITLTGAASGGTGTLTSVWTGPNSYASSSISPASANSTVATLSATAAMAGTYTHIVTDTNGCKGIASATNTSFVMSLSQVPTTGLSARYNFTGNANDASGSANNGTLQGAPTSSADRITAASSAYTFNGTSQFVSTTTNLTSPNTFSYNIWFNTTTTSGGKLIGFGNSQIGLSGSYDRHLYMTNSGNLIFGVFPGSIQTIASPLSYNDGNWHMATASLSSNGMRLYLDGALVASNASITTGDIYTGFWKIGFDQLGGWTSQPTSNHFQGSLDDVLIYNKELSAAEITTLYTNPNGATSVGVCQGGTLNLTAFGIAGATYSWSGPSAYTSAVQNATVAAMSVAKTGIYTVVASHVNCPNTTTASSLGSINSALNPTLSQIPSSGLITKYDFTGNALDGSGLGNNGTLQSAPTTTTDRFGIASRAYIFNGTNQHVSTATQYTNPSNFTLSIWFRTTTTSGGKLIGFGNSQVGVSDSYDRHVYMTNSGNIIFGLYPGSVQTIASASAYNDGVWHLATASLSATNGAKLYIDGSLAASDAALTTGENLTGFWRIGYDNLDNWTNTPTSRFFAGSLDEVLIYNRELTAGEVTTIYSNAQGVSSPAACTGGTLNITATSLAGASYAWTGPNAFTSAVQNPTVASMSNAKTGTYTLILTAATGCISDPIYTTAAINTALNPDMSSIATASIALNYVFSGNANDFSGNANNGALQNAPTVITDRFLTANSAYTFNGTNQMVSSTTQLNTPTNFSISVWFRTTTTTGGKLVGFGDTQVGSSGAYDKHLYMTNAGRIVFGVYPGSVQTITSPTALNDGNWHHAIGSLSSTNGMKLYIDGVLVVSNASVTTSEDFTGYWKVGFDNLSGWTNAPTSSYFNGSLDDIAIYNKEVSLAEVASLNSNAATGSNSPVCAGSPIFLTAKAISGATYSWSGPNLFTSGIQNPSIASAVAANGGTYNVTAVVPSTGCTSTPVSVVVVVSPTTIANNTISSAQSICGSGTPAPLTGTTPTGGSGGFTYQWLASTTSSSSGFNNIASATIINYAPGVLSANTWYRRDAINSGCKNSSTSLQITINPIGTWVGTTSTAWNTGTNWCGGVPTSTTDVIVTSAPSNQPQITGITVISNSLTINSGATLTLLSGQSLNIYGNFTNNGTFTDNGGTVSYLGASAQTALNMTTVRNLTLNNAAGLTFSSNTRVNGVLTLTSGALTSNGRLTLSLTTGAIAPTGAGSVVGNMIVRRESSDFTTADLRSNFHYVGSPLSGATFSDISNDVPFTATTIYGYNEGSGHTYIQQRWKPLNLIPGTTLINSQIYTGGPSAMIGVALKFATLPTTTQILDFTGTYTHGAVTSFTTGNMSYSDGGQGWGNGWQLLANPYPSYIDWRLVSTSNLENGITYYNSTTNNNADYIPINMPFPESFNNGGSPFIPAMQAYWVQVKPGGNGVVTVPNSARVLSPNFAGYGTVPSFYREARPTAQCFKLVASNVNGTDETNIRFGKGATRKFDGQFDIYKTGVNSNIPTISSQIDGVEYAINSLPEIDATPTVGVNLIPAVSGNYTISIKDLLNMESFVAVNLYDKKINVSQNLLINDTYSFAAAKGDSKDRFEINFQPALITNTNNIAGSSAINISSNSNSAVIIRATNAISGTANVIITNILGQEVYKSLTVDISTGTAEIKIENPSSAIYIVKAIIDGRTYAKEVYLSK